MLKTYLIIQQGNNYSLDEYDLGGILDSFIQHCKEVPPSSLKYLSVSEVAATLKKSVQSIYNDIHNNVFVEGKHYFKPSGKILFLESALVEYIQGEIKNTIGQPTLPPFSSGKEQSATPTHLKKSAPNKDYVNI